jgi:segregation and condensation protein B
MSEDTQKSQSGLATKQIIEGLLMAAGKPLPMSKIAEVFEDRERPEPEELKAVLKEIEQDCEARGFELKQVASGYRFQVKQQFSEWVGKLWEEKPQRYSRALLETISIIAYRQPITRGEIEKIRGVAVSTNIIRTLMEREWVRVVGHRDVPGRPAMYATTREFLDYFNLRSLEELPPLADVKELEDLEPELSLEDDAPESRVLEFPSAEDMEAEFDVLDEEEERAAAIGTRPIEEILGIQEEEPEEDWDDDFNDDVTDDVTDEVDAAPSETGDEAPDDADEDSDAFEDVTGDDDDAIISDDDDNEDDDEEEYNPSA